jgi:hypothetical protein
MKKLLDPQVQALWQVGFIRPIDFLLCLSWMAVFVTAIVFWWTGKLEVLNALVFIFLECSIALFWVVLLTYRTCHHVVLARADINTMPEAAARLAVTYKQS